MNYILQNMSFTKGEEFQKMSNFVKFYEILVTAIVKSFSFSQIAKPRKLYAFQPWIHLS
jgi:hypothetical protein